MTPTDVSRRLDQRLRLLTSADRSAPGRHRTLEGAMRWSYELLDETQRKVFDHCSVLAGPFTIDAAEAVIVGHGVDEWEVLDGILALVDKSLILADEATGSTRYRLLETMRQFGQANLSAAGALRHYRDRHADYYADYVLSRRPRLYGLGDRAALNEIERELENIRVALRHAADDHSSARFEELYSALYELWLVTGHSEGLSWATELKARPDLDPAIRIRALGVVAAAANIHSVPFAEELARAADDLWATTRAAPPLLAISIVSVAALMQGRIQEAIAGCDRVVTLAPDEPDLFIRGSALSNSLAVLASCGAVDRIWDLRTDAETTAEELGNQFLTLTLWTAMAPIIHVTDPAHAREFLLRTYELCGVIRFPASQGMTAMFLALHELRSGDVVAAARWANRSLHLAIDYAPSFVAQTVDAIVAAVKRQSRADAAILLGALRAHRGRKQQAGTEGEIDAESRYEASLRRQLGAEFDALYSKGQAFDEAAMISLAFTQLDAIIGSSGEPAGS